MIENPTDVLHCFPIRKSKKQKQAFRDALQSYISDLGYSVETEKGSFGAQNLVIGNTKTAKYLVTAHYDTPAALPFPNLITPCNPVTFLLYQLFVVGLFLIVGIGTGILAGLLLGDLQHGSMIGVIVYWILLLLMLFGPANKHNANDNTSGVVTVLEVARSVPPEYRDKVAFILFDLEEAGLIGSDSYRKQHKTETKDQIVLNCDCVGDGNELMLFPNKKLKKDPAMMERLSVMESVEGEKSLKLRRKGFSIYPSDQKNFPLGVGIAAFRRSKWAGLYCDKIHTRKDTVLEVKNVSILRDSILRLITAG